MGKHKKNKSLTIEKATGDYETFSEEKLTQSLCHAGASPEIARQVVHSLRDKIYPGIKTSKLYRLAFTHLQKRVRSLAARYSLKRAIMNLGPSGFPFERLIGGLFETMGYQVRTGVVLPGACVSHEVDVVAHREEHRVLVECKFHNNPGKKSDVKEALYVYARSLDLKKNRDGLPFNEFWLVTNTRFTTDAMQYAQCVGLKLLGWDYPGEKCLKDWVERSSLHPITCLTTLTKLHKTLLLEKRIVLCKELLDQPEILVNLGLKETQQAKIQKEILDLKNCSH